MQFFLAHGAGHVMGTAAIFAFPCILFGVMFYSLRKSGR